MKKTTSILFFIFIMKILIFSHPIQSIKIYGQIKDYKWANNSNHLAVLFEDSNYNNFIYIINAVNRKIIKKIYLSNFDFKNTYTFDWLKNDDGFLLGVEKEPFFPEYYKFYFETGDVELFPIEPDLCHINDIVIEKSSEYYVVLEECEGCVEIIAYNIENKKVFSTGEYLTYIHLLNIDNNKIFIKTDIPFDKWSKTSITNKVLYLYWEIPEDEKLKKKNFGGKEDFLYSETYVFEIDITNGKVKKTDLFYKDLLNTSFDKKYYMTLEQKYSNNYKIKWFEINIY